MYNHKQPPTYLDKFQDGPTSVLDNDVCGRRILGDALANNGLVDLAFKKGGIRGVEPF